MRSRVRGGAEVGDGKVGKGGVFRGSRESDELRRGSDEV